MASGGNFYKNHAQHHFPYAILEYGSDTVFDEQTYEQALIPAVKRAAQRSSNQAGGSDPTKVIRGGGGGEDERQPPDHAPLTSQGREKNLFKQVKRIEALQERADNITARWDRAQKAGGGEGGNGLGAGGGSGGGGGGRGGGSGGRVFPSLSGSHYSLVRSIGSLGDGIFGDTGALAQGTGVETDTARLEQARVSGVLQCRGSVALSSDLVLHCEPAGTRDRKQSWAMISWQTGDCAARVEALFELDSVVYAVVWSLDKPVRPLHKREGLPFDRAGLLAGGLYVVKALTIQQRALIFPDLDTDGLFWLFPEVPDWPDVLSD